jgi:hypothetical protein
MRRVLVAVLVAGLVAISVAACGGQSSTQKAEAICTKIEASSKKFARNYLAPLGKKIEQSNFDKLANDQLHVAELRHGVRGCQEFGP